MAVEFLQDTNINGTFQVKGAGAANKFLVGNSTTRVYNTLRLDLDLQAGTSYGTTGQVLTSNGVGNTVSWETPSGGISGSGAAGQITFWSSASAVTGENNFWWDSANNRLGIYDTTPSYDIDIGTNSTASDRVLRLNAFDGVESIYTAYYMADSVSGSGNNHGARIMSQYGTSTGEIWFSGYTGSAITEYGRFYNTGRLQLNQYGSGTFTGTATKMLAVTATGIVVEETLPTGGGSMNDWRLDADTAVSWPTTISDGEVVQVYGGTGISTSGTLPSAGVSRVTINQSSYFDTKMFYSAWKIGTSGTVYFDWTGSGDQSSLSYPNMLAIPANGVLRQVDVRTDVTQTGFTFALLRVGGTAIWTSSSTSLTADTTTTLTPNATITKSSHEVLHFRMVRATSASNNANIIITLTFEWDT